MKIKFEFDVISQVDLNFPKQIRNALDEYSDGRENFHLEVIKHHLSCILENSHSRFILDEMYEKYGNEAVPNGPGRITARAVLEADKIIKENAAYFQITTVSLEE
jgi:hypothetical protein